MYIIYFDFHSFPHSFISSLIHSLLRLILPHSFHLSFALPHSFPRSFTLSLTPSPHSPSLTPSLALPPTHSLPPSLSQITRIISHLGSRITYKDRIILAFRGFGPSNKGGEVIWTCFTAVLTKTLPASRNTIAPAFPLLVSSLYIVIGPNKWWAMDRKI